MPEFADPITTGRSCAECRRQGERGPINANSDYGDIDDPRCWKHALYETSIFQRTKELQENGE